MSNQKNDEEILNFVDRLGIELLPAQKELLLNIAKMPKDKFIIYNGARCSVRTNYIHLLKLLDDGNTIIVRKGDLGQSDLGRRPNMTFIDEDIIKTPRS